MRIKVHELIESINHSYELGLSCKFDKKGGGMKVTRKFLYNYVKAVNEAWDLDLYVINNCGNMSVLLEKSVLVTGSVSKCCGALDYFLFGYAKGYSKHFVKKEDIQ